MSDWGLRILGTDGRVMLDHYDITARTSITTVVEHEHKASDGQDMNIIIPYQVPDDFMDFSASAQMIDYPSAHDFIPPHNVSLIDDKDARQIAVNVFTRDLDAGRIRDGLYTFAITVVALR